MNASVLADTSRLHPAYSENNTEMIYDYMLVYLKSSWAEQSTPAYVRISDADMPVTNLVWVGEETVRREVRRHQRHPKTIYLNFSLTCLYTYSCNYYAYIIYKDL